MTKRAALIQELDKLPAKDINEVIDFIAWLKHKKLKQIPETMLLSETVLAKEWNTPEEDEAWASL